MAYFADDWRLFRHSFTVTYFQHTCTYWRAHEWISRRFPMSNALFPAAGLLPDATA